MSQASLNLRFDTALTAQDPTTALTKLAQELKREGMPQREMYGLFTKYFQKHNEPEDPLCDAIADTMDIISGWCSHGRLFDSRLEGSDHNDSR